VDKRLVLLAPPAAGVPAPPEHHEPTHAAAGTVLYIEDNPSNIAFMRELGVEAVREYNHALVWEGAHRLARRWGTRFETCEAMIGAMATIPLPDVLGSETADAERLRDALLFEDRIEVQVHASRGRLWARVSGQIYNEPGDLDRLGEAVAARA
jgi:isopenicillin-N epimerase